MDVWTTLFEKISIWTFERFHVQQMSYTFRWTKWNLSIVLFPLPATTISSTAVSDFHYSRKTNYSRDESGKCFLLSNYVGLVWRMKRLRKYAITVLWRSLITSTNWVTWAKNIDRKYSLVIFLKGLGHHGIEIKNILPKYRPPKDLYSVLYCFFYLLRWISDELLLLPLP